MFGVEDGRGEEAPRRIEEFLVKAMSGHGKNFAFGDSFSRLFNKVLTK
jgi:hypothetical protein